MKLFILAMTLACCALPAHAHPTSTTHLHAPDDHQAEATPDQAELEAAVKAAAEDLCSTLGLRVGPGLACPQVAAAPAPHFDPPDPEAQPAPAPVPDAAPNTTVSITRDLDHDCDARCTHPDVRLAPAGRLLNVCDAHPLDLRRPPNQQEQALVETASKIVGEGFDGGRSPGDRVAAPGRSSS